MEKKKITLGDLMSARTDAASRKKLLDTIFSNWQNAKSSSSKTEWNIEELSEDLGLEGHFLGKSYFDLIVQTLKIDLPNKKLTKEEIDLLMNDFLKKVQ
jgi:hypothetical protein